MPTRTPGDRRAGERAVRHDLILRTARELAERDGWEQVTTRRLAEAIDHSQPVLYGHFPGGKTEIVAGVARAGFAELARCLRGPGTGSELWGLRDAVRAYVDFAGANPATYDAMFRLPTGLRFADLETPRELQDAFAALHQATSRGTGEAEVTTEVLWSALHGLALLTRDGRLRPEQAPDRIDALVEMFGPR